LITATTGVLPIVCHPPLLSLAVADQRKRCAIWTSSEVFGRPAVLDVIQLLTETFGAVGTHRSAERWAAFAVGFLLTTAILLVIF
jgi:hypothetical protein